MMVVATAMLVCVFFGANGNDEKKVSALLKSEGFFRPRPLPRFHVRVFHPALGSSPWPWPLLNCSMICATGYECTMKARYSTNTVTNASRVTIDR